MDKSSELRIIHFINVARWQKTNYINAHEYTVREWNPRLEEDFDFMVSLINQLGEDMQFRFFATTKVYRYLRINSYKYWAMGTKDDIVSLINRVLV